MAQQRPRLLSVSADLARSTEIKTLIEDICETEEQKQKILVEYHSLLTAVEKQVYDRLLANKKIDFLRLYLSKLIGDEIWFLYDLNDLSESDQQVAVSVLINTFADLASRTHTVSARKQDLNKGSYADARKQMEAAGYHQVNTSVKVTIDLLERYINLASERQEEIFGGIRSSVYRKYQDHRDMTRDQQRDEAAGWVKTNLVRLANNLLLGSVREDTAVDETERVHFDYIRFDPIGVDVDLFFRLTSHSIQSLVMIGEKAAEMVGLVRKGQNVLLVDHQYKSQRHAVVPKLLSADQLKGYGRDYLTYYLPDRHAGGLFVEHRYQQRYDCFGKARDLLVHEGFLMPHPGNTESWTDKGYRLYNPTQKFK